MNEASKGSDAPNSDSDDADQIDLDESLKNIEAILADTESGSSTSGVGGATPPEGEAMHQTAKRPRRLVGLLALLLGAVGCGLAVGAAVLSLRLVTQAGDVVDNAVAPIEVAFQRLDTRIDQTDNLIREERFDGELRARVDGTVDLAERTRSDFEAIADHPLYRYLPANLDPLDTALAGFVDSAELLDERLGSSSTVRSTAAAAMANEVDAMQAKVGQTQAVLRDAASSLRRWIRLAGLGGFLLSLWSLWGQATLMRRGWRGIRARAL